MKAGRHIDQFLSGFSAGDAISNEAVLIRDHLRGRGFRSDIYCEQFTEQDAGTVHPYGAYHARRDSVIIYHHSFHTRILQRLSAYAARKVLIYHNVTPPDHVAPYNRRMAESLARAREELRGLRGSFDAVFAVSRFNATELGALGFADVDLLPVPVVTAERHGSELPGHLRYLEAGPLNVLFVGRVVPNKRHQDLIKAFYFIHRREPRARLILVGAFHPGARGYAAELHNLVCELGLGSAVVFTGMVPPEELPCYYRTSHVFVSMSEHEGFFVPLVECMQYGVPILAFASTVVPETLGSSGVLFFQKDFPRVAIMAEKLARPGALRDGVLAGQAKRARDFRPSDSLEILDRTLDGLG